MPRFQRKRPSEYLLPFFVIVSIGVIGVLGFRLWSGLQAQHGDVYFYVVAGKAKVLNYGTSEWIDAYSGTKLLLGDSLKTAQNGRAVLQFFNGSIARIGEDSEVTLMDLSKRSDNEKIALTLNHGTVWVNKGKSEGVKQSTVEVRTSHTLVSDVGTVFEVSSGQVETVRVLRGNVKVHILDTSDGKNKKLDIIDVGVGQEANFDTAVLKAFENRQNPSVLMALSDQFRVSQWYSWNSQEDQKPTDFSKPFSMPPVFGDADGKPAQSGAVNLEAEKKNALPSPDVSIKDVKNQGTVLTQTAKTTESGATEKNIKAKQNLEEKAKSGDKNAKPGDQKTTPGDQKTKPGDQNATQTKPTAASGQNPQDSKSASTQIKLKEALTSPFVLTFNGENISRNSMSAETNRSIVTVEGEVHGAAKIVVNGFTLTKFQPGSTRWIYYANEKGDNLKPGRNEYEVYAIDADGKESERTKFEIIYNKVEKPVAGTEEKSTTQQKP